MLNCNRVSPKQLCSLRFIEIFLIIPLSVMLLLAAIGFAFKITINPYYFWVALFTSVVATSLINHRYLQLPTKILQRGLFFGGLILILCFAFSNLFLGLAFDGISYHQPTVLSLSHGWNPFYDWNGTEFFEQSKPLFGQQFHIQFNHFGLGGELIEAIIYKGTAIYESSKFYNYVYIVVIGLIGYRFFNRFDTLSKQSALLLAIAFALNPVIGYQTPTFYVDGQLASLLTIFILLLLDSIFFADKLSLFEASCIFILLINVKLTGVVFGIFFAGLFFIFSLLSNRKISKQLFFSLLIAFILGFFLVGFQPYTINLITYLNPFYPVSTSTNTSILLTEGMQTAFRLQNPWMQLFISLFHTQYVNAGKIPLKFIVFPQIYDARYAGFGFIFGYLLVLSLPLIFAQKNKKILFSILIIVASLFLTTGVWWARIEPQLWMVPILILAGILISQTKPFLIKFSKIILWLLLINSVGIFISANLYQAGNSLRAKADMKKLADNHIQLVISTQNANLAELKMLTAAGVKFQIKPNAHCQQPIKIQYFTHTYCE